jgi:hypothetical protein
MSDNDPMRYYTTDTFGNRVLRGLTPSETSELEDMRQRERDGQDVDKARFDELRSKHEVARIRAVSAEVEARHAPKQ